MAYVSDIIFFTKDAPNLFSFEKKDPLKVWLEYFIIELQTYILNSDLTEIE
jgi:hypothetical protein